MPNAHFVFTPTSYDSEQLLPQVSRALERRTELVSRQRYPGMWRITDSLRKIPTGRKRSPLRTRVLSILCLVLGILLLVPGLMEPQELMVPLVAGAVAVGAGISGLWNRQKHRKNPFDKSATILLSGLQTLPQGQDLQVSFSRDGMTLGTSAKEEQSIPWEQFTCAVQTADTFLFVYEDKVLLLQKKDLREGTPEDLCALLAAQIQNFASV